MKKAIGASAPGSPSDQDRAKAKLPPPPEEDSELNVLLRPGLLTDIEIVVEKIPDAISIPNQAILEKDGKQFVYVQENGRFQQRFVKIAKRSESATIIAEALKPGETVALADPFAVKSNSKSEKKSNAMSGLPGGGTKGGK